MLHIYKQVHHRNYKFVNCRFLGPNSYTGISTSFNFSQVVKYLVENGADIHKPNINGGTCLINSVQSVDLCKFLIEKNADVNAQDNSGKNQGLIYSGRIFI